MGRGMESGVVANMSGAAYGDPLSNIEQVAERYHRRGCIQLPLAP